MSPFERFSQSFTKTHIVDWQQQPYQGNDSSLANLFSILGGSTFEQGLFRIHTPETAIFWDEIIRQCFPEYAGKIACFGFDWYGRQYAIAANGEPELFMFDCAAFEDLSLEITLDDFLNKALVSSRYDTLLEDEYQKWLAKCPDPLAFHQCVGFKIPLFLGGAEDTSNLETTDMVLYWEFTQQLYNGL